MGFASLSSHEVKVSNTNENGKQCSERIRMQKRQWQVWELVLVLKITVKNLLSAHLAVVVHHLAWRQFTFHANQIHILGLIISTEEYIVLYGRNGETDWYTANGTHCKSGYVVIMRTDTSEFEDLQRRWADEPGRVHGIIYRKAFGESCKYENVVGEGFGIIDGKLKIFSGAFNLAKGN